MTVLPGGKETKMVHGDIYGGAPEVQEAKAEAAKRTKARRRELRKIQVDHEARVGKRGSANRAGMMRPTAELERRHEIVVGTHQMIDERTGGVVRSVAPKVMTQTPLDRYYRRRTIDARQFRAGETLRELWHRSGLEPHTTANLLGAGVGGECSYGMPRSEAQAIARQQYRAIHRALGIRLAPVLVAVCCEDHSATDWALSRGIRDVAPKLKEPGGRSKTAEVEGMMALRISLDVLADYLGIDATEPS